ncbi:MAG: hypothetical protein L6R42_006432 [Xanthoria sp. 1 TBL-2021]|nr:MAG: hypothetical protein L6R42_006432 [Xanthoria sp. 1 TBL-2021]
MSLFVKFLSICREQLFANLPYPETPFTDQIVVVTGSNTGLGLEAARHYVRLGAARVILAVRSLEKGEAAKRSLDESEKRLGVVEVWHLDLSSYDSVRQFAKRANDLPRLDVLLENAGIATGQFRITEDNESTITTNVVSTFLLALLLLPKLRESSTKFNTTPHLTIVTSEVHFFTNFPEKDSPDIFDTLNNPDTARMSERYEVSKLLEVFYLRELASRTATTTNKNNVIILNLVNPGLCHSELAREGDVRVRAMKFFLARTAEVGSRNLLYATAAGRETRGKVAPLVTSKVGVETQKRLWAELNMELEKIEPGVTSDI